MKKILTHSLFIFLLFSSNVFAAERIKKFNPDINYNNFNAVQKSDYLWSQIQAYKYDMPAGLPTGHFVNSMVNLIKSMKFKNTAPSFLDFSDFKEPGYKLLHRYGSTGKIELVITNPNTPYTGIFKTGAIGYGRFSLAIEGSTFTPGFVLKFLLDKGPSVNTHVMYALNGQGTDNNFFGNVQSNEIPVPEGPLKIAADGFTKIIKELKVKRPDLNYNGSSFWRPIIHFASVDRHGNKIANPNAPRHISFVPAVGGASLPSTFVAPLRVMLTKIKPDTVLYDVYVDDLNSADHLKYRLTKLNNNNRAEVERGLGIKIGQLILRSDFVASEFETRVLNFQHTF